MDLIYRFCIMFRRLEGLKMAAKNRQRWRFTTGKQYECSYCGKRFDKRYLSKEEKERSYIYCSATCNMHDVGMSWSDFY